MHKKKASVLNAVNSFISHLCKENALWNVLAIGLPFLKWCELMVYRELRSIWGVNFRARKEKLQTAAMEDCQRVMYAVICCLCCHENNYTAEPTILLYQDTKRLEWYRTAWDGNIAECQTLSYRAGEITRIKLSGAIAGSHSSAIRCVSSSLIFKNSP